MAGSKKLRGNDLAYFLNILKEWQTLVAAFIALAAALATIWMMQTQARDERARQRDALHRKGLAARAQMPDALSALSRFTEECVKWYDSKGAPPDLPTDAISALKNAIEFVESGAARTIFELISFYQVHNSRLFSPHTSPAGPEAADRLFDTTRLRCLVDRLFSYARNEVETVPENKPTQKDMMTALKIVATLPYVSEHKERYERVRDLIAKRYT
jgi:hypothetical protein